MVESKVPCHSKGPPPRFAFSQSCLNIHDDSESHRLLHVGLSSTVPLVSARARSSSQEQRFLLVTESPGGCKKAAKKRYQVLAARNANI